MKSYKKTILGSFLAVLIGTSCCWLSSLAIWLGGVTVVGMIINFIQDQQTLLITLGIMLLAITLILYATIKRKKGNS